MTWSDTKISNLNSSAISLCTCATKIKDACTRYISEDASTGGLTTTQASGLCDAIEVYAGILFNNYNSFSGTYVTGV